MERQSSVQTVSDEALRAIIHATLDACLTPELLEVCKDPDKREWFLCQLKQECVRAVKYADLKEGPCVLERSEYGFYELKKKEKSHE